MAKLIDRDTLIGWQMASKTEHINANIHPSGVDVEAYIKSGRLDALRVGEYLNPDQYVMDYGCGNGRVLQFIPNKKVGVDAVKELADSVNGFTPDEFAGKVDVIYSISVFIHNSYETGCEVIKWMKEHINTGGMLLLQIPIYDKSKNPGSWTDVGVWTKDMLKSAVEGLEIIEMHTNPGSFSFETIGENHHKFQILKA